MYEQVGDAAKIEQWQRVFASVKRRLLHGHPESSLPGGETKEELTIMDHVRRFIELFKNPNFVGFSKEPTVGTASPAPASTHAPPPVSKTPSATAQFTSTSTSAGVGQTNLADATIKEGPTALTAGPADEKPVKAEQSTSSSSA